MMKTNRVALFFCLVLFACQEIPAKASENSDEEKLPYLAGQCVAQAEEMIREGKFVDAIARLTSFQKKQDGISAEKAEKKGYSHYYIDYMLGNALMMQVEKSGVGQQSIDKKSRAGLERAAHHYLQAVKKREDCAPAWLNLANCYYSMGRMAAASEGFVKGYTFSAPEKRKAEYLYYGAMCRFQAGGEENGKEAHTLFKQLMKHHPKSISLEWLESYVTILLSIKYDKTALPHIHTLARKFQGKRQEQWQEILLNQYLTLKMEKEAIQYVNELIDSDPVNSKWWKARCHLYLNLNRLKPGLISLMVYGYLEPLTREEKSLMADLFLTLDMPSKAASIYESLLKTSFDDALAQRLIHAEQMSGRPEKAIVWVEQLLNNEPPDKDAEGTSLLAYKESILRQLQLDQEMKRQLGI